MGVFTMMVFTCIVQVSFISISLAGRVIYNEDIGALEPVWQYLNYEEPEFNESKGLTADYFSDDYVGIYTKKNWPLPFLWDYADEGELPWAGMIIGKERALDEACGATLLTEQILMTICACVRTIAYQFATAKDPLMRPLDLDQGTDISVVMETIEYHPETLYPKITEAVATDLCMGWEPSSSAMLRNLYKHVVEPAIFKFSPEIDHGVAVPWPPPPLAYDTGEGGTPEETYFTKVASIKKSSLYRFVSFGYESVENLRSHDNFGKEIKTAYRLVKVRESLADQTECQGHQLFLELEAKKWQFGSRAEERNAILCWRHQPEPKTELLFQYWRDPTIPHYIKSVTAGLRGSPIEHKGQFSGWQLDLLPNTEEFITSRGVDEDLIDYVNHHVPELAKGNRPNVHDRNRLHFAIHDQKIFLPEPDLQQEEVNAIEWSLVGKSRFERGFSGVESISPGRKFILAVSLVQIFTMGLFKNEI